MHERPKVMDALEEALRPYCGAYAPYAALAAVCALATSAATDEHRASLERMIADLRAALPKPDGK